jgi:glutaminyl-tRNA synthetase
VSAPHAVSAEVRLYDRLFTVESPDEAPEGLDFRSNLNPDSLKTITALVEPCLLNARAGDKYQFERLGYFCADPDSTEDKPVFNRTVTLKDSWAKQMLH